jgi:hypothetical protein
MMKSSMSGRKLPATPYRALRPAKKFGIKTIEEISIV